MPLDVKGPNGEPLTIDIAWFGSTKPHNVFLHSSGLHGVEGFAGSAIQLRALEAVPQQSKTAFIFVNTLNPYGMAWLRRANENNVDLNRNFCEQDEFTGCPDGYRKLHDLICPASPPGSDAFLLRALWHIAKHGFQSVKRAVALGQYEFPDGLFYGGKELEQGPKLYLEWLQNHLSGAERMIAIDIHTGLGPSGHESMFMEPHGKSSPVSGLIRKFPGKSLGIMHDSDNAYQIAGAMSDLVRNRLDIPHIDFFTVEFGTVSGLKLISAMRDETRCHLHGSKDINDPTKKHLKDVFCLPDEKWKRQVVQQGIETIAMAYKYFN